MKTELETKLSQLLSNYKTERNYLLTQTKGRSSKAYLNGRIAQLEITIYHFDSFLNVNENGYKIPEHINF